MILFTDFFLNNSPNYTQIQIQKSKQLPKGNWEKSEIRKVFVKKNALL